MKYMSEFVRKQRALTARIFKGRIVWDSSPRKNGKGFTYVKKIHGELK